MTISSTALTNRETLKRKRFPPKRCLCQRSENMRTRSILVLVMLSVCVLGASATNGEQRTQVNNRRNDAANDAWSRSERNIEVRIMPVAYSREARDYVTREQFRVGEPIRIALNMINNSTEPTGIMRGDIYFHARPRLLRDTQPVRYRREVPRILRSRDENGPGLGPIISIPLEPGQLTGVHFLYLNQWYEPLEPGRYQLTVRYRFRMGGRTVDSNTVTFEVVP